MQIFSARAFFGIIAAVVLIVICLAVGLSVPVSVVVGVIVGPLITSTLLGGVADRFDHWLNTMK